MPVHTSVPERSSRGKWEKLAYFEDVGETFETPPWMQARDVARREGVAGKNKKASSLANPKEQKATQRKKMRREENRKKSWGRGERGERRNAVARKENCTKTRRCVAQLAGRDEGEKYPEGEIPSICVHVRCVCVCV